MLCKSKEASVSLNDGINHAYARLINLSAVQLNVILQQNKFYLPVEEVKLKFFAM